MRFDRFTIRGQEAVQEAIGIAEKAENQQVEPEHILASMMAQAEGVVKPMLGKIGANAQTIVQPIIPQTQSAFAEGATIRTTAAFRVAAPVADGQQIPAPKTE